MGDLNHCLRTVADPMIRCFHSLLDLMLECLLMSGGSEALSVNCGGSNGET